MRQLFFFIALCCWTLANGQRVETDSAWRPEVKTVTLTREGVEMEAPVLTMTYNHTLSTSERMLLQFDLLADEAQNLRYSFFHCDANWQRDNLEPTEFMWGFEEGEIENYEFSFTTLRPYVHYHQMVPAKGSSFTHSGNYIVAVTDEEGDTLLTRRFWVNEGHVGVDAEIAKPYDGADLKRRQEVDVVLKEFKPKAQTSISPIYLRPEYERVLVQQNGRWDNARWLEFSGYDGPKLAYRYRQQNIFDGGNRFRFFDCSNLHTPMYNVQNVEEYGGETFALLRPEEDRSRKHFLNEMTLNGGMKVNIADRNRPAIEAEYVWVSFSLPIEQPMLDKSVYVVGALTDWKLDSTSRMDYNPKFKAYVKRLLLKQGYYAYQLLVCSPRTSLGGQTTQSATATLEGDHWETPNDYTIFVYHREPSDRADRLVAVKRVKN